jgi:molecular chaperone DnaK (HSP70)
MTSPKDKYSIAIDFGTTNSVVARWDASAGQPEVINLPGLSLGTQEDQPGLDLSLSRRSLVPSLLYVQDGRLGQVAAGQAVLAGQLERQHDNRLFRAFKRGVIAGTDLEPRLIDGVPWTDSDAGRHFINCLVSALPFALEEVEQLVLTVPVAAFEGYVAWLRKAVPPLLAERIRVVDESTAAALGYAVTQPGAIVLVIDFGGGSLDMSLAQLAEGKDHLGLMGRLMGHAERQNAARVIAKAGVSLGGSDIDQWLLGEVLQRSGLTVEGLGLGYAALLNACEQAKITLSTQEQAAVDFISAEGKPHSVTLQRAELEKLLAANGFYSTLRQALDKVMSIAHRRAVFKEDVNQVLMAGGTSLMPSVQAVLQEYFNAHSDQNERDLSSMPAWPAVQWSDRQTPVRVDKPFTAIVEGALQVAAGYGLDDYLVHSYGLRYLDMQTGKHAYDEIIPMGSRYPTQKPVQVVLGAAHQNQTALEFVLAQVDTDDVSTVEVRYEAGQAVFVAQADPKARRIMLVNAPGRTIVPLAGSGRPGRDRLSASFSVDAQRRLRLTVLDLQTRQELLSEAVVAALDEQVQPADKKGKVSGLEPCLPAAAATSGRYHLSLRGLSTMLNLLPPEAISLEALAESLRSPDYAVRYNAAELLSKRGDRDARRVFEDVFAKGEALLRASAAQHLHRFSWFAAEPLYHLALADAELRVRESAVLSLCKLRTPKPMTCSPKCCRRLVMCPCWQPPGG